MKKLVSILALTLFGLILLTACGKKDPDAPYFELTSEERSNLEQQLEEVKNSITSAGSEENGDNYLHLGELYMRLSDYKNANEAYQKAADYQPKSGLVHESLATTHEYLGEYDEALQEIDRAIKISQNYAPFYLNKIRLLRFKQEKSTDKMVDTYKDAIAATNADGGVLIAAAEHYEIEGEEEGSSTKIQQALVFYRQVLAKKPDNESVLAKVEKLERLLEDFDENQEK